MSETAVRFYGKVLDQNNGPVIGAKITYSWPFMTSMDAPGERRSEAPDGNFEVSGVKAATLHFFVHPPKGYSTTGESDKEIQFAEYSGRLKKVYENLGLAIPPPHKRDKTTPVIFRVEKIGPADALYHGELRDNLPTNGDSRYFSLKTYSRKSLNQPPDNHTIEFSLIASAGDFIVPTKNRTYRKQYSWSLRIRVPAGGIMPVSADSKDRDAAPEDGYKESILLDYPKSMDEMKWRNRISSGIFVRFSDGTYARVLLYSTPRGISMESFYNPTGSRNILYDDSKEIPLEIRTEGK